MYSQIHHKKPEKRALICPTNPVPTSVIVSPFYKSNYERPKEQPPENAIDVLKKLPPPELSEPKKNYSKCLDNYIEKIQNLKVKPIKNKSDLDEEKQITVNEIVTKNVNIPFDKKLYKELISLRTVENTKQRPEQKHSLLKQGSGQAKKDKIPKLKDFFVPKSKREYTIPVQTVLIQQKTPGDFQGLRVFNVSKNWRE